MPHSNLAWRTTQIAYRPCQQLAPSRTTSKPELCGDEMGRQQPCGAWICDNCWLAHWENCDVCYEMEQQMIGHGV